MFVALILAASQSASSTLSLNVDGVERTALVVSPRSRAQKPPIVFAFHGHMGNSSQASRSFRIEKYWPEAVVVYPQGLPTPSPLVDPMGRFPGWSLDSGDDNRDIRFFDALYKEIVRRWHPSSKQVFAMGHSNGGAFVYTLWSARGTLFAGFGSMEAAGARKYRLTPKPIFVTIGSRDQIVKPALQRLSFKSVLKVNEAAAAGKPFGQLGTLYEGKAPTVLWEYDGTHAFPKDSVPSLIAFFKAQI